MITANACDAMCWSIMCSSFSSSVRKRNRKREREPKKYSCFKYCCQTLLLLSTKWWMTLSDLKRTRIKTSTSNWTLTVTDPSLSSLSSFLHSIHASQLFLFLPSCHLFPASRFLPSSFPFANNMKKREDELWACLCVLMWDARRDEKKSSEMNNESTALMTAQHFFFVFSGAFHFVLETFFVPN